MWVGTMYGTARQLGLTLIAICFVQYAYYRVADSARVEVRLEGPAFQYEPAYVRVRVRVQRDPANRSLGVALVSDGFERYSMEQLDGDRAALVRWIEYRDVPAGDYAVTATVWRQDRSVQHASARMMVLSRHDGA